MELGGAGITVREKITITPPKSGVLSCSYHLDWMERGIQLNEVFNAVFSCMNKVLFTERLRKNKSHNTNNYKLTVHNAS